MNHIKCLLMLILFLFVWPNFVNSSQNIAESLSEKERNWLKQNHTVRVRVGNWPPFMFCEGGFQGISVEYIKRIFATHEINYQFISDKQVPWAMALEKIKDHQVIDLILTAKITETRKKDMLFTDEYLFLPWVIFSRTDASFIGGINDLAGKTVSVPYGYVMHDLLKEKYPEIRLVVISGDNLEPRCLKALAQGEVDAYIGNLTVGSYTIQAKGYSNIKVAAPTPFGTHNQAMAVRNDWPELVTIINKTLGNFTSEQHSEIKNRWLSIRYEHGIHPIEVLQWILGVAGILIVILLFVLLWNRMLSKEISERKKVEKKLQYSENRYRGLSDASFEGILVTEKGKIVDGNKALEKMFGYSLEEAIGMKATEYVAPEMQEDVQNKLLSSYEKPYETLGVHRDGTTIPIEVHTKIFSYQDRQVRVTAIRDISERKKAAEEIKTLQGLLPICAHCKKIRDDKGYWNQIESYIQKHSEAEFSHSLCPDCSDKFYGDQAWYIKKKKKRARE